MPDIEDGIFEILTSDTRLTTLLNGRVRASDRMPDDNVYPALAFWCMTDGLPTTMGGLAGLSRPIYQFHYYALTLEEVVDIRRAVIRLLVGYKGTTQESQVSIDSILPYGEGGRQIAFTQDTKLFGWETELIINWNEDFS